MRPQNAFFIALGLAVTAAFATFSSANTNAVTSAPALDDFATDGPPILAVRNTCSENCTIDDGDCLLACMDASDMACVDGCDVLDSTFLDCIDDCVHKALPVATAAAVFEPLDAVKVEQHDLRNICFDYKLCYNKNCESSANLYCRVSCNFQYAYYCRHGCSIGCPSWINSTQPSTTHLPTATTASKVEAIGARRSSLDQPEPLPMKLCHQYCDGRDQGCHDQCDHAASWYMCQLGCGHFDIGCFQNCSRQYPEFDHRVTVAISADYSSTAIEEFDRQVANTGDADNECREEYPDADEDLHQKCLQSKRSIACYFACPDDDKKCFNKCADLTRYHHLAEYINGVDFTPPNQIPFTPCGQRKRDLIPALGRGIPEVEQLERRSPCLDRCQPYDRQCLRVIIETCYDETISICKSQCPDISITEDCVLNCVEAAYPSTSSVVTLNTPATTLQAHTTPANRGTCLDNCDPSDTDCLMKCQEQMGDPPCMMRCWGLENPYNCMKECADSKVPRLP